MFRSLLVFVFLMILAGCAAETGAQNSAETEEGRKKSEQQLEQEIDALDKKLDELERKLIATRKQAQEELKQKIPELREKQASLKKDLAKLRSASGAAWEEIRTGTEQALQEMEKAFDRASTRFNRRWQQEDKEPEQ